MLVDKVEIYTLSLVFIGDFNPVILQPFWLANKKLIREQEAESAKIEIIHNDIVKFSLDWAEIQISNSRFEIKSSKEPYFEAIKDLAISIFRHLKETPIRQLGINHLKHFNLNEDEILKLERILTPMNNWSSLIRHPKLARIEIVEAPREDEFKGNKRLAIQRSDQLSSGILINLNDHYTVKESESGRDGEIFRILASVWESSKFLSNEITNNFETMYKLS